MWDCNDACFFVSQHWPLAMPGEVQEVCVGGNLEIWWCSKPGRKYLQSTIDLGTIIEPNNYFPPAARKGITREYCPGVSSSKRQRRIGFACLAKCWSKGQELQNPEWDKRKSKRELPDACKRVHPQKSMKTWSKYHRTGWGYLAARCH